MSFGMIFLIFFRSIWGSKLIVFDVFLMSWRHRNILKVILDRFGIIHFFIIFIIIFMIFWSIVDAIVLWRYPFVSLDSFKYNQYNHKEKIGEAHVFFLFIAPAKIQKYSSKIIKKYALAHGSIC